MATLTEIVLLSFILCLLGAIYYLYNQITDSKAKITKLEQLRAEERKGRTKLEASLRNKADTSVKVDEKKESPFQTVHWQAIGNLHSCFDQRNGTPRNFGVVESSVATLKLRPDLQRACVEGLEAFSHVWLISCFHQNTNAKEGTTFKAKVSPPRLAGAKTGVFSTRTPHRPNNLSLSLVKLDKIVGSTLYLSGIDMIDGTPVIDVKPYIPQYDSFPSATVPEWIVSPPTPKPTWSISIPTQWEQVITSHLKKSKLYQSDTKKFFTLLSEVLSIDIRSVYKREAAEGPGQEKCIHTVSLIGLLITFELFKDQLTVTDVKKNPALSKQEIS